MLTVLTYNIYAPVAEPTRFTGQTERMRRIPAALQAVNAKYNLDVICLQESIVPEYHAILMDGFKACGFVHVTEPVKRPTKLVEGGVFILSRWPIEASDIHIYDGPCDGADCLAAKGVVYARIRKHGVRYHVFSTHLQAWHFNRHLRKIQIDEMGRFIREHNIPEDEPLVLMGDLNIDRYTQAAEIEYVQEATGLRLLDQTGSLYSVDPTTNQLVGSDGDTEYKSFEYPDGCYEEYLRTLYCVCCQTVSVDHVLSNGQGTSRIIPIKVKPKFLAHVGVSVMETIDDLSDHYPVVAEVRWPAIKSVITDRPRQTEKTDDLYLWISLAFFAMFVISLAWVVIRT